MWVASARSARLPVQIPTAASTRRKAEVMLKTASRRCLWREAWVCRPCTGARSAGRRQHQPRFPLPDALAREESGVGLDRVPEGTEWPVHLGGARVHPEDGEDATVLLDEGDVQRGRDVLHVELGHDLAAEVEEDQVPLDLLGRGALEAA